MGKTIALLGGSFNPPHPGHVEMARFIKDSFDIDEVWMLFSISPWKNPEDYASLEHRVNMGRLLADTMNADVVMSDIEKKLAKRAGTHETHGILKELKKERPDDTFLWVMGADQFAAFHKWTNYREIAENYCICVVNRPGYVMQALTGETAQNLSDLQINRSDIEYKGLPSCGWFFNRGSPLVNISSSGFLKSIHDGETEFEGPLQLIADYIYEHGLYATNEVSTTAKKQLKL